ncbi:MAG: endonuclease domain-containing protein [bacterium]|nr:endonuclease domain-containing protein [bacterium]
MGMIHNQKRSTPIRRNLRKIVPEPEQRLWYFLRNKRLLGYKFRRQQSFGRYVVDFYCAELHLAIEIDGDSHYTTDAESYDRERTKYLNVCGIQVLRYTNTEVMKNINGVVEDIASHLPSP